MMHCVTVGQYLSVNESKHVQFRFRDSCWQRSNDYNDVWNGAVACSYLSRRNRVVVITVLTDKQGEWDRERGSERNCNGEIKRLSPADVDEKQQLLIFLSQIYINRQTHLNCMILQRHVVGFALTLKIITVWTEAVLGFKTGLDRLDLTAEHIKKV